MRLFDTHCHFETTDATEIRAILERAKAAGVECLMAVGGSPALNSAAIAAAELSEGKSAEGESLPRVLCAVGLDRDQANSSNPPLLHSPTFELSNSQTFELSSYQNLWKVEPWKTEMKDYAKANPTRTEEVEGGTITLKLAASGAVTAEEAAAV